MMKRLTIITCAIALLALFAVQTSAKEITVRGRLGRTVEEGGWVIVSSKNGTKYLLLNPQRFRSKSWFRLGAEVEATGEIKSDVMTIYQEGTPFEARTMKPRSVARSSNRFAAAPPWINSFKPGKLAGWPENSNRSDLNSIGTTQLSPRLPRLM